MSYPVNYPTPQGANVQIFYRTEDWVKPQGASFVWFTLIGAGGVGDPGQPRGGGSGAVTNFMGPAFLIPDILRVTVGVGNGSGTATSVSYFQKSISAFTLLQANSAVSTVPGTASTSNYFSCMGFYQSVGGQAGESESPTLASAFTFLSGGTSSGQSVTGNYGYSTPTASGKGYFQMQPIIVGLGGSDNGPGGIGCGGGTTGSAGSRGGDGLVVIITW